METVLITGAGRKSGLGFETARQLGEMGYQIILAARKEDTLDELVQELKQKNITASYVLMDITSEDSVKKGCGNDRERIWKT